MKKLIIILLTLLNFTSYSQRDLDSLFRKKDKNLYGLSQNSYTTSDKSLITAIKPTATKNLVDKNKCLDGVYMDNGGNVTYLSSFGITDYISVTPGITYSCQDGILGARFTTYYDASKNVVAGGSNNAVLTITPTTGVAFVRFTYNIGTFQGKDFFQVEAGSYSKYASGEQLIIENNAISPKALQFVSKSKNLFNKNSSGVSFGRYMDNGGNVTTLSGFYISDFIEVVPGIRYNFYDGKVGARFTTYYDPQKNIVAGGSNSPVTLIQVPSGVKYIRFTGIIDGIYNSNSMQFEFGWTATNYQPFEYNFSSYRKLSNYPQSPIWGKENLKSWQDYKLNTSQNYDMVFMGDSYTDGGYYTSILYSQLLTKYTVSTGYCSFFSNDNGTLPSQSINSTKLYATRGAVGQWSSVFGSTSAGLNASETNSIASNATIALTTTEGNGTIDIIYKRKSGGGSFTYNINGGSNTTVSTSNATTDIQKVSIDVSSYTTGCTINITALVSGVTLYGAIARKAGNSLTLHKAGLTGSQAGFFAKDALFQTIAGYTNPKLVTFMWGTNDINANILPSVMKQNIQTMVNYYLAINPQCDFIFMCPNEQTYGSAENVRNYLTTDYAEVMYQLAIENRGCFIDFQRIFGPFSQNQVDQGYIHGDRVHPGTKGCNVMAGTMLNLF